VCERGAGPLLVALAVGPVAGRGSVRRAPTGLLGTVHDVRRDLQRLSACHTATAKFSHDARECELHAVEENLVARINVRGAAVRRYWRSLQSLRKAV